MDLYHFILFLFKDELSLDTSLTGSLTENTQLQSLPDHTFPKTCQKLIHGGDPLSCLTEFKGLRRQAGEGRAQDTIFFLHNFSNRQVSPPEEINPVSTEKSHLPKQLQYNTEIGITIFLFQTIFSYNIPSPREGPFI